MSCRKCGCELYYCRCDFDNEADFIKYGQCFFELESPVTLKSRIRSILSSLWRKLNSYPILRDK